ncbi:small GTP-binding domain protein [Nitzschia inconspicua]|uniref:Small GTP-binding domain protein n=1 Tax=Nitzschia inconspicua TaxID=303405 RepID=A0A9K3PJW5_9STRA|nr:small GTP-binding domain protein [Nitzschia inconspicua]
MEKNRNNVQSSTNDRINPSIKKQKTRKVTALTSLKATLEIDEEDYKNLQEILRFKISDDTSIEDAVCHVATIDPYSGQYRVSELSLRDESAAGRCWYGLPHLPFSLCTMDALEKIEIMGTQIETLFSEDDDADFPKVIPNLCILQLTWMPRLQGLPSNLGSFTKLQKLQLFKLPINALPDSLSLLGGSLKAVVIRDCANLTHLPDGFGQLHSLQYLETYRTPIQRLPDNFGNLTNLEELEMEFHHLTQLPTGFTNFAILHTLDTGTVIFNFPVPHLPNLYYLTTSVYNIHQFSQTQTVRELKLYCHCDNVTQAPAIDIEFYYLSTWRNLERLNVTLTGHPFEYTLPKGSFTTFTKLKFLILYCTERQALGVYIDELPCLLQLNKMQLFGCMLKSTKPLAHPVTLPNLTSISLHDVKGCLQLLSSIRAPCLT